jgi:hypothetical protein
MSMSNSPSVVTNGLVFYYDMYNPSSYTGPPLTNLLPNGINAGYPTSPTGWGTYNTNQYGSGTYFSIGTITGVASNIITCPNHPLRTYDVVQPQSSGGGLTGGTNYLVRKWDTNTFSLYSYDSTQDSTNIFQTQVNLNTDNRVAVSSGVSNMWWGYPHLPNSGIMKQTITNGFNWQGRVHDCLRIHWYRADGVCDGMAYGNEPSITAGQTYTISFYHRAATPNCVGYSASINRWTNGEYTSSNFTVGKNWQKFSYTFTTSQSGTTYFYWFNANMPAQSAFDLAEIMIYQGSGSSEYVTSGSTRSSTQSVLDLTNTNTITASSLTYNSDGTFSFNGSSNYLTCGSNSMNNFTAGITLEAWVNMNTSSTSWTRIFDFGAGQNIDNLILCQYSTTNEIVFYIIVGSTQYSLVTSNSAITNNTNTHFVATANGSNWYIYRNGIQIATQARSILPANVTRNSNYMGKSNWPDPYLNGKIYNAKIYNRALAPSEVAQNFNAQRGLYGI